LVRKETNRWYSSRFTTWTRFKHSILYYLNYNNSSLEKSYSKYWTINKNEVIIDIIYNYSLFYRFFLVYYYYSTFQMICKVSCRRN